MALSAGNFSLAFRGRADTMFSEIHDGGGEEKPMGWTPVTKAAGTAGTAEGSTPLNAFDNALLAAGIGNINLVRVSSILPPGVELIPLPKIKPGAIVPTAYASMSSEVPGESIRVKIGTNRRTTKNTTVTTTNTTARRTATVSNVTATSTPYLRKPTSRLDRLIGCGTRIILLARYRAPSRDDGARRGGYLLANSGRGVNATSAQPVVQLAGHQQTVLAVGSSFKSLRAVQPRFKRDGFRVIRGQTQDHYLIRRAHKHFSHEPGAGACEFHACDGIVEIQFATIVLNGGMGEG
jgi:pyruvoyl-dependent arginine decarboxylase